MAVAASAPPPTQPNSQRPPPPELTAEQRQKMNLHQRMNWVQQQVDYVQKNKPAGLSYSIVSHDAVTSACRPHMVAAGILAYPCSIDTKQDGDRTEMRVCTRFVNVDMPGDTFDVETLGYGVDKSDKGPGKAMSYAVKYAYLKAFGLETGDDPDFDQNVVHTPSKQTDIERIIDSAETVADLADVPNTIKSSNLSQQLKLMLQQKYAARYREFVPKGAAKHQPPASDFPGDPGYTG